MESRILAPYLIVVLAASAGCFGSEAGHDGAPTSKATSIIEGASDAYTWRVMEGGFALQRPENTIGDGQGRILQAVATFNDEVQVHQINRPRDQEAEWWYVTLDGPNLTTGALNPNEASSSGAWPNDLNVEGRLPGDDGGVIWTPIPHEGGGVGGWSLSFFEEPFGYRKVHDTTLAEGDQSGSLHWERRPQDWSFATDTYSITVSSSTPADEHLTSWPWATHGILRVWVQSLSVSGALQSPGYDVSLRIETGGGRPLHEQRLAHPEGRLQSFVILVEPGVGPMRVSLTSASMTPSALRLSYCVDELAALQEEWSCADDWRKQNVRGPLPPP